MFYILVLFLILTAGGWIASTGQGGCLHEGELKIKKIHSPLINSASKFGRLSTKFPADARFSFINSSTKVDFHLPNFPHTLKNGPIFPPLHFLIPSGNVLQNPLFFTPFLLCGDSVLPKIPSPSFPLRALCVLSGLLPCKGCGEIVLPYIEHLYYAGMHGMIRGGSANEIFRRQQMEFNLHAPYKPTGDQPEAIRQLVDGVQSQMKHQVLLGATGTGKTFTIANLIQQTQKATLVMAHNKTLAAQLYAEFKEFFPENAVEYFVSYYDYYQPEAYVPRRDLYIEKETDINEEIERLRLAATTALMSRKDVIIVSSVSCIYGLGNPEEFGKGLVHLVKGEIYRRNALLRQLVESQYQRNDMEIRSGTFRVRGDTLEIMPAYEKDRIYRVSFFGDEVEKITDVHSITGEIFNTLSDLDIYPAKQYIAEGERLKAAIARIEQELEERIAYFKSQNMLLEAQRVEQRCRYDIEMLKEVGYCSGIENYSRQIDDRPAGSAPWTLIDYLPSDYMLVIDESHMSVPQIRGMFNGDRRRKQVLVDYGFRLPSAMDNRPLKFEEFEQHMGQVVYTSATPGPYEMGLANQVVEQIIRPTGLIDPEIEVRPTAGQVDDLLKEINLRVAVGERVLVTTLTKRMAEDLAKYLEELGIKVQYLHSEVETLERVEILRDLRMGMYDVLVGINLLREGLDLPEVSLVAILDADKEGFLRSGTSLIQTIGRAARHLHGKVIMYGDKMTDSMARALDETNRRRKKQDDYNKLHHISPVSIQKEVRDITLRLSGASGIAEKRAEYKTKTGVHPVMMPKAEFTRVILEMEKQMKSLARDLEFERAAALRDEMYELKRMYAEMSDLPPWEKARILAGEI
jgi:excinuclease ABC subunit B